MRLLTEYKSTIKGLYVEEIMDLVLYRPISFFLVKLCYPFPITPNQLSLLAMATGIGAGLCFALGNQESFMIGGLLFALANVIDCSDGMLARLKKNGTITGRLVDGVVDYVVSISLYSGLLVGLTHAREINMIELPFSPFLMCAIAGASNILSSGITDHFRNRYLTYVYDKPVIPLQELQSFRRELGGLKGRKGRFFDKIMIKVYIRYTQFQLGHDPKPVVRYDGRQYKKYNRWLLLLWNFIGPTTHFSVLVISALLYQPMIFFAYGILFANTWILILYPIQWWANRKLTPLSD
ncbi:MAG: CDP-alcohol phosphatidyltransferase family protein [Candidatus Aminicenantes bacterium]|nr:CDP-alcohol phosphatidyltransferase family protein [Candidatus Aminicenantes bacterium]